MKKGEIGITVIIIIALGLIVLTILSVLLVASFSDVEQTRTACEDTYGGACMPHSSCIDSGGRVVAPGTCGDEVQTTSYGGSSWNTISFNLRGDVCCIN